MNSSAKTLVLTRISTKSIANVGTSANIVLRRELASDMSTSLKMKSTSSLPAFRIKLPIPDLRFEQVFRKKLLVAAQQQSKARAKTTDVDPLPIITPTLVIYTIFKDQIIMPFVQGFGYAFAFMLLRPWLQKFYQMGKSMGVRIVTGLTYLSSSLRPTTI
ncbi:hypothetical protein OGAPHI_004430 [Ogataea philodendri]|uniref:Uncharacterized protein n=1 Tax=Ogataea philodendri TaxID=1378263 RepID=A0A9P8T4Y7_9ASCO|nr:uncharacterized protein OGAPHI_004430 [Ogataea philodendri]KAH3666241.1 hypothetical protein OGAPHI_004430 [Ogataea philodendri]